MLLYTPQSESPNDLINYCSASITSIYFYGNLIILFNLSAALHSSSMPHIQVVGVYWNYVSGKNIKIVALSYRRWYIQIGTAIKQKQKKKKDINFNFHRLRHVPL
jgi:hypothetical protein